MQILIAGAAGVVGRLLVPKLIQAGHEVTGITHKEENMHLIEAMGARAINADVFDREAIFAVLDKALPEVVIHQLTSLASRNFPDNSKIRITGTRNLVDAALAVGVKKMIAQSIAWAYEPGDGPATEEIPLDLHAAEPARQRTVAGVTALEQAVAEIPSSVILRYGMFYGPGTWYEKGGYEAEAMRNQQLKATDGITSFLHIEDAANAAFQALNWPNGPVNIVDDEPARGTEWLSDFAEVVGAPRPDADSLSAPSPWERGASNAKARRTYGWEPLYPTWRGGF